MRIKRTTPTTRTSVRTRLLAIAAGVAAVTALAVPAAGAATPARDAATLARVSDAVNQAHVVGTAWYTDPKSGQVVVTADRTVTPAALDKIAKAAGSDAAVIKVQHTNGVFSKLMSAGDAIYGGGYRCSLGFNVVSGSTYYFLTAGHCGNAVASWYADSSQFTYIGPTVASNFPGTDYALVRYDNGSLSHPGGWTAAYAYVGEWVTRTGSTSGTHSGSVTGLNATVNYPEGTVYGLIQTDVCAEPGDSGGPLYDSFYALGLTSGGSGNCTSGGTTFFQPVPDALNAYGVSIY